MLTGLIEKTQGKAKCFNIDDFKGGDASRKEKEIDDLIRDVGLTTDKDKMAY
jgi:hypothetical protein